MKTLLLLAVFTYQLAHAETVDCHVSYGGETQVISATPNVSPYDVAPVSIGSYFMFRLVFERTPAGLAAVKTYTYADRDPPQGATLLHQADFAYPLPAARGAYGFTGLQRVYEPIRDGELLYWCGWRKGTR